MSREKYTREALENAIKQSLSYSDVLKLLNMSYTSSNHRHIKSRISNYKLDTSHFLGNTGSNHKGGGEKLTPEVALVLDRHNGRREETSILRKMMILSGIKEMCCKCGIGSEWNNQKLVLQIDHINGNGLDNRIENIRFLCPNCHSQTDTFGTKNAKYNIDIIISHKHMSLS